MSCTTQRVSPPPPPVDPATAATFFSGVIDGPHYAPTAAWAVPEPIPSIGPLVTGWPMPARCPTPGREAVARQNALEAAFAEHPQFKTTLAVECAALGTLDFGDDEEDLAVDACNPPPDPSDFGEPLPTATS